LDQRVPVGGFADRIKGICFGFLVAAAAGRPFFIDWRMPTPLLNTYKPASLDWRPAPALLAQRQGARHCDWVDNGFTDAVVEAMERDQAEADLFQNAPLVFYFGNLFRPHHLSHPNVSARLAALGFDLSDPHLLLGQVFRRLLRFSAEGLASEKAAAFETFKAQHPKVLGVQFRTGGDGSWEDPQMDKGAHAALMAEAAMLRGSAMGEGTAFFVTTDSVVARDELVSRLQGAGAVFTFDVEPMHVDRSSADHAARLADFVPAEFHALTLCDDVVHGAGGFGLVASWAAGRHPVYYRSLVD
jgi:hypothetical protein